MVFYCQKQNISFLRYLIAISIDIKLSLMRYLPRTHKKACNGLDNWQAYSKSEISMKETASHSNTPAFTKNESNTKPVLYQHPTASEMQTSRWEIIWANAKDFAIFIATALVLWFVITLALVYFFGG